MGDPHVRVLLVENDQDYARSVRHALNGTVFTVEWVRRLSEGIERLSRKDIGAVLLDLFLPDSQGIETFIETTAGNRTSCESMDLSWCQYRRSLKFE